MRYLVICLFLSWGQAQTLTIFAASSLSQAFEALASEFEAQYPGTRLVLNFAASSLLSRQLEQGASADLFASADLANLVNLVPESSVSIFAKNKLAVIVADSSTLHDLADLAEQDYLLVLAAETVPIGHYARTVLQNLNACYGQDYASKVLRNLVSLEANVRQAAAKVELGEADASLVYETDLQILNRVRKIDLPERYNVIAEYPVAVLPQSANPELARHFLLFLLTDGQAILESLGFQKP